jgi:hypothetical protein
VQAYAQDEEATTIVHKKERQKRYLKASLTTLFFKRFIFFQRKLVYFLKNKKLLKI